MQEAEAARARAEREAAQVVARKREEERAALEALKRSFAMSASIEASASFASEQTEAAPAHRASLSVDGSMVLAHEMNGDGSSGGDSTTQLPIVDRTAEDLEAAQVRFISASELHVAASEPLLHPRNCCFALKVPLAWYLASCGVMVRRGSMPSFVECVMSDQCKGVDLPVSIVCDHHQAQRMQMAILGVAGEVSSTFLKEQMKHDASAEGGDGASPARSEFEHWARQAALICHAGTAGALRTAVEQRQDTLPDDSTGAAQVQVAVRLLGAASAMPTANTIGCRTEGAPVQCKPEAPYDDADPVAFDDASLRLQALVLAVDI